MILASTGEQKIAETNANAPVGTTLALLEVESRMSSAILRNFHNSLTNELEMLFNLFGENLDQPFDFAIEGGNATITKEHFDGSVKIVPVSDPSTMTSTQRIVRAETQLNLANSAPQLYDMREAHRRMHMAIGTNDLEKLMPPPEEAQALDPVTENYNAILGKALKVALWQAHDPHIAVHSVELNNPQVSDEAKQNLAAHIQEHVASNYIIQMQMAMGMPLPELEQGQDPQAQQQNQIALQAAEVASQQMQAQAQQQQAQQPPDPNTVLMLDIQQREKAAQLNFEIKMAEIEWDKEKTMLDIQIRQEELDKKQETEAFNAQLKFESEMKKLEVQQDIAEEKHDVELAKVHLTQRGRDHGKNT